MSIKILIAGGGTGGHVFPGVAVAEALEKMDGHTSVMWIGTGRPVERNILKDRGWIYRVLDVKPVYGHGMPGTVMAMLALPLALLRALSLIGKFKPDVVLGVGGYVSGPVIVAARLAGKRVAIHEQNFAPGLANRWAGRFAHVILTSFSGTASYFPAGCLEKIECTGNPVRLSLVEKAAGYGVRRRGREPSVLVLGGSQGAAGLNRLAASALQGLGKSGLPVRVVHQAGPGRVEETEQFYREMKNARVVEFIDDMAMAYGKADLVICRAGATTIAELSALGKPSVLIPYPYSAEGHQDVNARVMAENGAALYFQQADTGSVMLGSEIEKLLKDEKRLDSMGKKAKVLGKPEAAERIAASLLDMVVERHDPVQGKCIKNS